MSQQSIPYDGYPAPGALCTKNIWLGDHFGSNNYQAGGYNLNASQLGMSRVHWVNFSFLAQSGNYYPRAIFANTSAPAEQRATGFPNFTVKWYFANGTEANNNANLAAEVAQMEVFGY